MNYYSTNPEILRAVVSLLGDGFSNASRASFGVAYSQNRKLSIVTVELSPSTTIHALFFIYTKGMVLYDVIRYSNKASQSINRSASDLKRVERIHELLTRWIPKISQTASLRIAEEQNSDEEKERKEQEIQRLKNRMEVEKSINKGLRDQIKVLRAKKAQGE